MPQPGPEDEIAGLGWSSLREKWAEEMLFYTEAQIRCGVQNTAI